MRRFFGGLFGYACVLLVALLTAEFVSGSSTIPVIVLPNLMAYVPYWLVFLGVSARAGPLSFRTHYLFGALIGLGTESFITKVVWGHPQSWTPVLGMLGGFGIYELFFLVLVYHPLFSCAVPFLLLRHYLGLPQSAPMSDRWRRMALALLPVAAGLFLSLGRRPTEVAIGFVINTAMLVAVLAVFRGLRRAPSFRLPIWVMGVLIALIMAVAAINLPQRHMPSSLTLMITLVGVGLLILLVVRSVAIDKRVPAEPVPHTPTFSWRGLLSYLGYFAVVLAAFYTPVLVLGDAWRTVTIGLACLVGVAGNVYLASSVIRMIAVRR